MTPENGKAGAPKAPRHRSPNYPGISLKAAAEKIGNWYKADGLVASQKDAAMKHLAGDPGRVISALKSFGLITEENERIKLTQRGVDIVARPAEDSKRKQALKEAASSPAIYRDLMKEYPGGLPSDTTLQSELVASKHFNPNYVNDFIKDLRSTLDFAGISDAAVLGSEGEQQKQLPAIRVGDNVQWESQGVLQFTVPRRVRAISEDGEWVFVEGSETGVPIKELTVEQQSEAKSPPVLPESKHPAMQEPKPGIRQDVFSLAEGPVVIQWPAVLSADSYADLGDWLDILKRKIGRSVQKQAAINLLDSKLYKDEEPK